MFLRELETPVIVVRDAILQKNMKRYQDACNQHGKALWPMVKTHKSTEIAALQRNLGAEGFLCGTLDECEALCAMGARKIMYAYPVAGAVSCRRAVELAKKCEFYLRLDDLDGAAELNEEAEKQGTELFYTIIVDCGLHRFGRQPEDVAAFADEMQRFSHLRFAGISTHCGHVYGEADPAQVPRYVEDERKAIHTAVDALRDRGYDVRLVTTGATPTFWGILEDELVNVCHPGNYVFHDCIQLGNGSAREEDCALTVCATVISHPREDLFLCDAGAKCLGLDQGAHGNTSVRGHGRVLGHPELQLTDLSEEVGKLHVAGTTDLKVGDRIEIIPNHACSSANLTDWYVVVDENENVKRCVAVDIRANKTYKGFSE